MHNKLWRYGLSTALVLIALAASTEALYLYSKAWFAQRLLDSAWRQGEAEKETIKPWPWADIHPQGLLEVPNLGVRQVVLNDHSGESLAFGPGLAEGNGAVVLAGHRDSHFAFVQNLQLGDRVDWQRSGEGKRSYRVSAMHVLDSRKQEEIAVPADVLLLVTCFPFDAVTAGGPLRYVVEAKPMFSL